MKGGLCQLLRDVDPDTRAGDQPSCRALDSKINTHDTDAAQ
jgi:hypothetical protein